VIGAGIERETMERYAWAEEVLTYGDGANVWDASLESAVELVARGGPPRRIGIERPFLTVDLYGTLGERTGAEMIDVSDVLFGARHVKSDEGLALLRLGGELAPHS
jgi:Xaa-Pro aminopeptidase